MEKVKHTPGHWVVEKSATVFEIFSGDATTLVATSRRSLLSSKMDESAEANARLISASPDMLEALQEIVCAADCNGWDQLDPMLSKARTAIARATR